MLKLFRNGKEYLASPYEDGYLITRKDEKEDINCGYIGKVGLKLQIENELWLDIGVVNDSITNFK